ncbi:hypothetical protein [Acinetobacter oleivorans]|uniref:hypothetical protein n=1 Tax=Acinetobacter oleivorans TaxID=1148157 RepID=UPI003A847279
MSYKLIKIGLLSTIFLIGCGEDSQREENQYEKNILRVEAKNFNDKVNLNVKEEEYSLSADGNNPDVTLHFNKSDKTDFPIYGVLKLLGENKKASFSTLGWLNKDKNISFLFCIDYANCSSNTEYSFDNIGRKLNVRFKNNFNNLFENYLEGSGLEKTIPAMITGDLELKIPSNWLAFKKDRFPKKDGIGNLKVDSQIYKLSEMNSDINFYKDANGEYIGSVDQLNFKKGDDSVNIEIYKGIEDSQSFKDIRLKIYNYNKNNESFFLFDDLIPDSFVSWNEGGKILSINIEKLILVNRENSKTKILDLKFDIPRNTSNLTINNEKILILRQDYSFAYVINDRKKYAITLVGPAGNYPLEIIQEFNGNITIETIKENEKIVCGGRYKPCLGVSMENDKKTFRFNNVKLGKDVLDGTIYIPGVID